MKSDGLISLGHELISSIDTMGFLDDKGIFVNNNEVLSLFLSVLLIEIIGTIVAFDNKDEKLLVLCTFGSVYP